MRGQNKQLGFAGEELATQFLLQKGYRILARNYRTKYGEIDILAADGQAVVIVEVKTKTSSLYGSPLEMVGQAKQRKLRLLATELQSKQQQVEYRIDVVSVEFDSFGKAHIEHLIGAV